MTRTAALAFALLAAAAPGFAAGLPPVRDYQSCLDRVDRDPAAGREAASEWIRFGKAGAPGRICEAVALSALGANESAARSLDRAAKEEREDPALRASLWSLAAEFWLTDGRMTEAAVSADAALASAPEGDATRGDALRIRGLARLGNGEPEAAVIDLSGALGFQAQAGKAELWAARARARNRIGDADGALADAGEALARDPGLAAAQLEKGRAQFSLGRDEAAREALMQAIRADGPAPGGRIAAEARREIQARAYSN